MHSGTKAPHQTRTALNRQGGTRVKPRQHRETRAPQAGTLAGRSPGAPQSLSGTFLGTPYTTQWPKRQNRPQTAYSGSKSPFWGGGTG